MSVALTGTQRPRTILARRPHRYLLELGTPLTSGVLVLILCIFCISAVMAMAVLCLAGSGGSSNRDLEKRLEQRATDRARVDEPHSVAPSEQAADAVTTATDTRVSTTTP